MMFKKKLSFLKFISSVDSLLHGTYSFESSKSEDWYILNTTSALNIIKFKAKKMIICLPVLSNSNLAYFLMTL